MSEATAEADATVIESLVEPVASAEAETSVSPSQKPTEQAAVKSVKSDEEPEKVEDPIQKAEPADEEKKGQSRLNRKLDKAYRERAEAVARSETYQRENEELRASMRPPVIEGKPKIEDFDDLEKYTDLLAEYKSNEKMKVAENNQRQAAEQQQMSSLKAGWDNKVDEAEAKYPDYHEKVGDYVPNPEFPWSKAIMAADNGADIAYYLQANIAEATRITQLDPFFQVREITKLESKLANAQPVARKASQAPAPIKTLSGISSGISSEPQDSDDIKTWISKRNKQVHT